MDHLVYKQPNFILFNLNYLNRFVSQFKRKRRKSLRSSVKNKTGNKFNRFRHFNHFKSIYKFTILIY